MPELPEVETIRRGLGAAVAGRRIERVEWLDPRLVRGTVDADTLAARLAGRTTRHVGRHGKFLLWRFTGGGMLVLHLGMSGRILVSVPPTEPYAPHTHFVVRLSDGFQVRLVDPRRFGRIVWEERAGRLPALGPDALDPRWTADRFAAELARRSAPIKALLLDQRLVAGIGNIYADEALYAAGIDPRMPARMMTEDAVRRLHRALRSVLRRGIRDGGTTIRTYLDAAGRPGRHAAELLVYGRRGVPCRHCGTPIASVRVAGRTSYYCPQCQGPQGSRLLQDAGREAPVGATL
jgi:formamidopyrimidine-DNA glycosylase